MKVRALRGVCIGVERYLLPGEVGDVSATDVNALVGMGAVELVVDPVPPEPEPLPPVVSESFETKLKPGKKSGAKEK